MYDTYLDDARVFVAQARAATSQDDATRNYRAAVFHLASAVEAFVNYVSDTENILQPYEVAFLQDRLFEPKRGSFVVTERAKYYKLLEKMGYLLCRFVSDFDLETCPDYATLDKFIKFRHSIVHPRMDSEPPQKETFEIELTRGFGAAVRLMNRVCTGLFGKPLNKRLLELAEQR